MRRKIEGSFWIGYADLMTNLFFIMLALYAVTFYLLFKQKKIAEDKLAKIEAIEKSVQELAQTGHFTYDSTYKRFILNDKIEFERKQAEIQPKYHPVLIEVGQQIQALIQRKSGDRNVRYLVIIEGMASRDNYELNDELSYARALALYRLWTREGNIQFPAGTEVMVSGSGTGGVGRATREEENQRFLIQVIPKVKLD